MKFLMNNTQVLLILSLLLNLSICKNLNMTLFHRGNSKLQGKTQQTCTLPSTDGNATTISLGNCQDYLYYIQLGVGSPPQYFYYQFDTGSNVMWIPTIQALSVGFNTQQSSTYSVTSQQYTISYADGSEVVGSVGSDIVSMLNTNINVSNGILFVNTEHNMTFPGQIQGLVGMGYTVHPNFLDAAYHAGQISTNTFALQLQQSTSQSILYYDQIPEWLQNQTITSPIYGEGYWQLHVIGFFVGQQDWTSYTVSYAVIDSGTSLFYLNPTLYSQIISQYMSSCSTIFGQHICQCSQISMPTLTFMFPGVQLQITPQNYVQQKGNGVCIVQINTLSDQSDIILLGDTLFLDYIITFNKQQKSVGFNGKPDTDNSSKPYPKPIPIIGGSDDQWFITGSWIMFGICLAMLAVSLYLLYHLRVLNGTQIRSHMLKKRNEVSQPLTHIYGSPLSRSQGQQMVRY